MEEENEYVSLPFFGIPKILPYIKKYTWSIVAMLIAVLLGSAMDIIFPLFNRYAIDNFIGKGTVKGLGVFVLLYVLALLVQNAGNFVSAYLSARNEIAVDRDMRNYSFAHLQTLSFSYFNQNNVGYIHARVMSDTGRIGEIVSWNLLDLSWNTLYVVGVYVVMFSINVKLTLFVSVLVPISLALFAFFEKKLVFLNRKQRTLISKITGDFNEGITGAKTIKTLVVEETINNDFMKDTDDMRRLTVHTTHFSALFSVTISLKSTGESPNVNTSPPLKYLAYL
jgi:ATP-binding cassette subfamily B protein